MVRTRSEGLRGSQTRITQASPAIWAVFTDSYVSQGVGVPVVSSSPAVVSAPQQAPQATGLSVKSINSRITSLAPRIPSTLAGPVSTLAPTASRPTTSLGEFQQRRFTPPLDSDLYNILLAERQHDTEIPISASGLPVSTLATQADPLYVNPFGITPGAPVTNFPEGQPPVSAPGAPLESALPVELKGIRVSPLVHRVSRTLREARQGSVCFP